MSEYFYKSQSGTIYFELKNNKMFQIRLPQTPDSIRVIPDVSQCKTIEKYPIKINIEALELFLDGRFKQIEIEKVMKTWEMNFTPFFESIYRQVIEIKPGMTLSYKDVAELSGNANASRAVGNAMQRNRFPLLIPCHRVIGSDGQLVGYSGANGIATKKKLIKWEKQTVKSPSKKRFIF